MSNNNDISIGTTGATINSQPSIKIRPAHLLVVEESNGKSVITKNFVSLDKPEVVNGLVEVRGAFSDKTEDDIVNSYANILQRKEDIVEVMFPLNRIVRIRSLMFRAK